MKFSFGFHSYSSSLYEPTTKDTNSIISKTFVNPSTHSRPPELFTTALNMTIHTSQPSSSAPEGPGAPSNQEHDVRMEPVQFVSGSDNDLSDEDELLDEADLDITATSERSSSWATLSYTHLKKIVTKAKGAATKPVVRFIKKQ
jgi:hypothetical protein